MVESALYFLPETCPQLECLCGVRGDAVAPLPSARPGSDLEMVRSVAAAMEIFLPSRCDRNRNAATWEERERGGREGERGAAKARVSSL